MASDASLYESDFLAWTQQQAAALRDSIGHGANMPVDWENVAEEIDSLGQSLRRELRSGAGIVMEHLLKIGYSSASEPRAGWMDSVAEQRPQLRLLLEQSPSLRREAGGAVEREFPHAAKQAAESLQRHGQANSDRIGQLVRVPYTEEQVLGDWWPDGQPAA